MARILEHGDLTFLAAKLAIGAFAAYILYRCAHLPLAKRGLNIVLGIYVILMLVHVATGCVALGWQTPVVVLGYVEACPTPSCLFSFEITKLAATVLRCYNRLATARVSRAS